MSFTTNCGQEGADRYCIIQSPEETRSKSQTTSQGNDDGPCIVSTPVYNPNDPTKSSPSSQPGFSPPSHRTSEVVTCAPYSASLDMYGFSGYMGYPAYSAMVTNPYGAYLSTDGPISYHSQTGLYGQPALPRVLSNPNAWETQGTQYQPRPLRRAMPPWFLHRPLSDTSALVSQALQAGSTYVHCEQQLEGALKSPIVRRGGPSKSGRGPPTEILSARESAIKKAKADLATAKSSFRSAVHNLHFVWAHGNDVEESTEWSQNWIKAARSLHEQIAPPESQGIRDSDIIKIENILKANGFRRDRHVASRKLWNAQEEQLATIGGWY